MAKQFTSIDRVSRPEEYWYLDHWRGKRISVLRAALTALAALTLLGAAGCANNNASLAEQYQAVHSEETSRGTSDLLGGVVGTVSQTISTTLTTVEPILSVPPPVSLKVSIVSGRGTLQLSGTVVLKEAHIVTTSGEDLRFYLGGKNSASLIFDGRKSPSHFWLLGSNGSKWFFDRAGTFLPNGYVPTISMRAQNGKWYFDSTDAIDKVGVFFAGGDKDEKGFSSSGIQFPSDKGPISYFAVLLKSSGKWFCDNAGLPLPSGYRPKVEMYWNANQLQVTCSDVFEEVVLHYANGVNKSYSNSGLTGTFRNESDGTVTSIELRVKSDSSKWYFDNVAVPCEKWYNDTDSARTEGVLTEKWYVDCD